jgi:hypothetical protein
MTACEDALHLSVHHHGEVLLRTGQEKIDRVAECVRRGQCPEVRQHRAMQRNAGERGLHLRHAGLLTGANPDEEGNEQQYRVALQSDEREDDGHPLTDDCGARCRACVFHAHGKQRPKGTTAVHRECGKKVEADEVQIGQHDALEESTARDAHSVD